jgi:seryl-tRNA synthetase
MMLGADRVVAALRARGELWESAPGLVGLRGDALALRATLERLVAAAAGAEAHEEWAPPPALALATLARASYFASFPQWLTLAAHLREDAASLERVARSDDPAAEARGACAPADAALPPAVCYHVYAALAGRALGAASVVTAQGTCWRHEGDRLRPLARGWAFTMREGVCVGDADAAAGFRERGARRAVSLAESLGLDARLEEATDPFFAPTARGRQLVQRLKGLKQELMLPVGGEAVAAASFNLHERFFGDAFDIRLGDGSPAASACVAYGVERWLLAFLAAHGTDPRGWPALPAPHAALPHELPHEVPA